MKTFKLSITLLALLILPLAQSYAAVEEYGKTINKEFNVNKDATLDVSNKYGKVHITTWDKNVVKIDVKITVDVKTKEEADKLLNKINVVFNASSSKVEATTKMDTKNNKSTKKLSIDYTISMPASNDLDVTNKFGDVYINELDGKCNVDISYGSFNAGNLRHVENNIDLQFSQGNIQYIERANMDLQYSEIEIEKSPKINFDSQFSEIELSKVGKLDVDSQYDTYIIKGVGELNMDSQFSTVKLGRLTSKLSLDIGYGAFKLGGVDKSFESINIDNQFGDIAIEFREGANFNFEADISMGDFNFPDGATITKKKKSYTSAEYTGSVGGGSSAKVIIESQYGGVRLAME